MEGDRVDVEWTKKKIAIIKEMMRVQKQESWLSGTKEKDLRKEEAAKFECNPDVCSKREVSKIIPQSTGLIERTMVFSTVNR